MISEYKPLFKTKFVYIWVSQVFSQVTINMMNFLLLARLYTVTGSSIATSLLWVAFALPALIFGPIGAAVTDLVSRRKTLMVTNLLQGLTIFAYWYIGDQSIFILYAVVLIYSLLNQFYMPAEAAFVPSTVSPARLPQANSLFFITSQATIIFGFAFAGIIQNIIGFEGALILCATFLFAAFVSTSFLTEVKPQKVIPEKFEHALKTFSDSIIEGYQFIKANKQVLYPLLLLIGIQVGLSIIIISLPVVAEQILGIAVQYVGFLVVVPAGIGALTASILVPKILKKGFRKKRVIEVALFLLAFSGFLISTIVPTLPLFQRLMAAIILVCLVGVGFVGTNIPTFTFLQTETPAWLRGRVFGNLFFLGTVITVFPVLFSGTITEIFGLRTMIFLMALATFTLFTYSRRHGELMIRKDFRR